MKSIIVSFGWLAALGIVGYLLAHAEHIGARSEAIMLRTVLVCVLVTGAGLLLASGNADRLAMMVLR